MFPMETIMIQNIKHVVEMQPWELQLLNPNLFKHHHFHNSPGKLSPKLITLQTGFKQNFNTFIDHLQ